MRHCQAPLRIQEQSPQGFHGQFYRNPTSLRVFKALIWLILDQDFPQVWRTWGGGALRKGMGAGLSQNMGGTSGELKMLSKGLCEGVHLIVKLLPTSLQACKFTKKSTSSHIFSRILARL